MFRSDTSSNKAAVKRWSRHTKTVQLSHFWKIESHGNLNSTRIFSERHNTPWMLDADKRVGTGTQVIKTCSETSSKRQIAKWRVGGWEGHLQWTSEMRNGTFWDSEIF